MILYKEYVPFKDKEIKFAISFNKELTNWATNQPKKRGYQVAVVPVQRTKKEYGIQMESCEAFTGFNDCLLECDRQSKKRLELAKFKMEKNKEKYLKYFENEL